MRYLCHLFCSGRWLHLWAALVAGGMRADEAAGAAPPGAAMAERRALFAYDPTADFHVVQRAVERRGSVTVRDITFVAVPGETARPVAAFLVVPEAAGPFAGVLWVHWLGEPATTNRTEFLEEAIALAPRGVVSLLVDAMWAAPKWYGSRVLAEDFTNSVRQVVALRRALDLLIGQHAVLGSRIGVVGHDYGAMYSALAAGVDARARTYVFIAATPSLTDWAFFAKKPATMDDYLRQNRPLELTDYLRAVQRGSFLMQFARQDEYVPLEKAQAFFSAAPQPKQLKIYDGAGHAMAVPSAIKADRDAWLAHELGFE